MYRASAPGTSARRSIHQPSQQELQAKQQQPPPQARRALTGAAPTAVSAPNANANGHVRLAAPATAAERVRAAREREREREREPPPEPQLFDGDGAADGVPALAEGGDALLQLSESTSSLSSDSIQRRKQLQQYLASHPRTPVSIERSAARAAATGKPHSQPNAGAGAGTLRVRLSYYS